MNFCLLKKKITCSTCGTVGGSGRRTKWNVFLEGKLDTQGKLLSGQTRKKGVPLSKFPGTALGTPLRINAEDPT